MSARYAAPRGNRYAAPCRVCGQTVPAGEGHYSRTAGVIHAPSRWVGSPVSGRFVGGCPPRDPDDTPTAPTHCPACGIPLTPANRLRVHAGGMSCGHGPHD